MKTELLETTEGTRVIRYTPDPLRWIAYKGEDETWSIRTETAIPIAKCIYRESNARGIVHFVNNSPSLVEALRDIVEQFEKTNVMVGADLSDSIRVFGKNALLEWDKGLTVNQTEIYAEQTNPTQQS